MMNYGELTMPNALVDLERRITVLESVLDFILGNNHIEFKPSVHDLERFNAEAKAQLQEKYPSLGIV